MAASCDSILSGLIKRSRSSWKVLERFALFLLEDRGVTPGLSFASLFADLGLWFRLLEFDSVAKFFLRDLGETLPLPLDISSSLPAQYNL